MQLTPSGCRFIVHGTPEGPTCRAINLIWEIQAEAAPNVYIALTHSGVTLAPLIGELAAIEIVDGVRVESLSPYRPERFL